MQAIKLIFSSTRYFAPALLFATLNIVFGTWAIYIPAITEKLSISEGKLGFAVFFIAVGTLTVLPFIPKLVNRFGLGKITTLAAVINCLAFIGPFAVTTYAGLCIALFFAGASGGFLDVSMNTLVSEIEKKDNVHFMSVSHGFFSLGGMISAGIGSLLIPVMPSPLVHISIFAGVMIVLNLVLAKNYFSIKSEPQAHDHRFNFKNLKPLFALGLIGFLIFAAEGAIVDWSALYLEQVTFAVVTVLGLGYTIFNATMALGRFFGDGISARYGSRSIIILGSLVGALGFGLVLTQNTWIAIAGFGCVGIGFSVIVPELLRYGGKLKNVPAAEGVSFISGIGFVGMLLGPVFLGFLAETFTLKTSFVALLCFAILSAGIGLTLKRKL